MTIPGNLFGAILSLNQRALARYKLRLSFTKCVMVSSVITYGLPMLLDPTLTTAYIVVAAALAFAPGPDVVFVLANSLRHKTRGAIAATLGVCAGTLLHSLAAAIGIAAVIAASPIAFDMLRYGGAAYLFYLGIRSTLSFFKSDSTRNNQTVADAPSVVKVFQQGLITNLLNPKVIIFYIALLPQFVNTDLGQVGLQIVLLGFIHTSIGLIYLLVIGTIAGNAAGWLTETRFGNYLDAIAGVFFIGLALRLALSERQ